MFQMIQRAVEARISFLENPNGRDFDGGDGGEVMTAVLDSLEKVRDKMGKTTQSWLYLDVISIIFIHMKLIR